MYIKCTQNDLWNAIQVVQKAVSTRSTLPILSGILFQAKEGKMTLSATNLELSIKYSIPVKVEKEGSVVIPARLVGDIVKNLPEATIEMFLDSSDNQVKLLCQESNFNIKILPPEDFPKFPDFKTNQSCVVGSLDLIEGIKQVIKSTSIDETRPILTGVFLNINNDKLKMVATDSYRLAIKEVDLKEGLKDKIKVIIPSKTLGELIKIISGEKKCDISLEFTDNQLIFKTNNIILISRLIEGQYPNYQQLLPEEYGVNIDVNKEDFINAVKRVSLFTRDNSPIKITVKEGVMELNAASSDLGEAIEKIKVEGVKEDINIAFNPLYLLEGLMSVGGERIIFEVINTVKPGLLRPKKGKNFLYLIMPVRVT